MMHALVGCGWAQGVWKITKFRELIVQNRHHDLWGLFQYARNVVTNSELPLFVLTLWGYLGSSK